MPRYKVTVTRKDVYVINVEASDESEAEESAFDIFCNMSDKYEYLVESDDIYLEAEEVEK